MQAQRSLRHVAEKETRLKGDTIMLFRLSGGCRVSMYSVGFASLNPRLLLLPPFRRKLIEILKTKSLITTVHFQFSIVHCFYLFDDALTISIAGTAYNGRFIICCCCL